jgi:putative ABC transport system permease protein
VVATHLGEGAALMDHVSLAAIAPRQQPAAARAEYWRMVRERLRGVTGVVAVTVMPAGGATTAQLATDSTGPGEHARVRVERIDGEFFEASGLTLREGSGLFGGVTQDATIALINERAARQLQLASGGVGQRLRLDGAPITIVGVVKDDGADSRIYQRLDGGEVASANVLIRTAGPATTALGAIRAVLMDAAFDRAFTRVSTLREASTGMLQRLTGMALTVAALVLSLAVVGLYGSMAFITAQRTREIAIRIAVGARRSTVLRMLLWEGGYVVLLGCVAGLGLTAAAFRFMSGMIFATWTLDPFAVAGVMATFSIATLAACYLPGRRATRIDPIRVLRE